MAKGGLTGADIRVIAITSAVAAAAGAVASAAVAGIITYWAEKRAEKKAAETATDTAIEAAELTVQDMLKPAAPAAGLGGYVVLAPGARVVPTYPIQRPMRAAYYVPRGYWPVRRVRRYWW